MSNKRLLNPYLAFAKTQFLSSIAFRWEVLFRIFRGLLSIGVRVALWTSLYGGVTQVDGVTLNDMVTYFVLSSAIECWYQLYVGGRIAEGILSGNIALDLLKPLNIKFVYIASSIGRALSGQIFQDLPMLIVAILVFRINGPVSMLGLLVAFGTLILGVIITTYLELIAGLLAFWMQRAATNYNWYFRAFHMLFSGTIVPLWFYPDWLLSIANALPFKYTLFVPLSIYLGQTAISEVPILVLQMILWIITLGFIERLMWKIGIKKIVINGG